VLKWVAGAIAAIVLLLVVAWVALMVARHFVNTEQNPSFGGAPAPSVARPLVTP